MTNFVGLAKLHRANAYSYIEGAGRTITVRQPPTKSSGSDDVAKVLGSDAQETGYGASDQVTAIMMTAEQGADSAANAYSRPSRVRVMGELSDADYVLRVKLEDVLLDADKPYGRTKFDTAKDVVVDGIKFEPVASIRTGKSPLPPYILWVGLITIGEDS